MAKYDNTANTHNFIKRAEALVIEFNVIGEEHMKRTLPDAHAEGIKETERF